MSKIPPRKQKVRETAATYGAVEVPASDLKNDWHHWLDTVARGRRTVIVTRYGTPIATLSPIEAGRDEGSVFGTLRGRVEAEVDLVGPTGERWDADG